MYARTVGGKWFSGGIMVHFGKTSGCVGIAWMVSGFLKSICRDYAHSTECVGHSGWEEVSRGNVSGMCIFAMTGRAHCGV
jgi:hypothetical protein